MSARRLPAPSVVDADRSGRDPISTVEFCLLPVERRCLPSTVRRTLAASVHPLSFLDGVLPEYEEEIMDLIGLVWRSLSVEHDCRWTDALRERGVDVIVRPPLTPLPAAYFELDPDTGRSPQGFDLW